MNWDEVIEEMQSDAVARLESEPFFSDVVVLEQRKGIVESDVETALSVFNEESGKKVGAVVIALMPEFTNNDSEAPGPELSALLQFHVVTIPLINTDATSGTNKSAEKIAANVLNTLHRYLSGLIPVVLVADQRPIIPLATEEPGVVSYLVRIVGKIVLNRRRKVATPSPSIAAGLMTLTCATASSTIYYTTDGSYPGPENAAAITYSVPFSVSAGSTIRAGATRTDYIPSDTSYYEIALQALGTGETGEGLGDGLGDLVGSGEVGIDED